MPSRLKGLEKFLLIFNQKVQYHKRGKFSYLEEIPIQKKPNIPSLGDGWFCGLVDADGCFSVSLLSTSTRYRIRFLVTQKGAENLPLLSLWILLFQCGRIERHSKPNVFSYVVSGLENCMKVQFYFQQFPFQTKKANSFRIWCEFFEHFQKKEHLDSSLRPSLLEKAKTLNQKSFILQFFKEFFSEKKKQFKSKK